MEQKSKFRDDIPLYARILIGVFCIACLGLMCAARATVHSGKHEDLAIQVESALPPVPVVDICGHNFAMDELHQYPELVYVIVLHETGCRSRPGAAGEVGPGQILPKYYTGNYDIYDYRQNIIAASEILAVNIEKWGYCDGVRRYNGSGPKAHNYACQRLKEFSMYMNSDLGTFTCAFCDTL